MSSPVHYFVVPPVDPPRTVGWMTVSTQPWEVRHGSVCKPVGYDRETGPEFPIARAERKGQVFLGFQSKCKTYCKLPASGFRPPHVVEEFEVLMGPEGTFKWMQVKDATLPKLVHLVVYAETPAGVPKLVCRIKNKAGNWTPATFSPGDKEARGLFLDVRASNFEVLTHT